jgi:hypothetical protein
MADDSHDVTMTTRLGSQNAKAVLDIMVRDALDEAGKNFLPLIVGSVFHSLNNRNADPNGQRNISLLRISAVKARSSAGGYAR